MPLQYINQLLELPELQLHSVLSIHAAEVHLEASPVAYKQPCPICCSEQAVKRDGRNKPRKIRHVSVFGKKCFLHIPSLRLACSRSNIGFVWSYAWVGPKEQYSRLFRSQTVNQALGSTAAHSARMQEAPASTVQRMHQEALPAENERLLDQAWRQAKNKAELFEVSLRTIYRDIETINQAGIPIVTSSGVGGGIGIMNEYKIEKGFFTVKDITALLMGLGFISNTLSGEETTATLAKVKSFIPEDKQHEITLKANQISFDLSAWLGSNDLQTKVEVIRTALEHCSILSFMYLSAKGDKVMRTVEPHRLLLKENHWYVQGYCLNRHQFRVFKLSRISELERTEDRFAMREIPPAFSEFTDTMSRKMQKIKLQLDHSILDRMLDYCGEENITPLGNGEFYAYLDFIEDDYGYGILMSFGDKCQCIEPKHVRNEMKRRLNDSIRAYY